MSYVTLAPFVAKRPWLKSAIMPLANWYANASGYRKLGLLADDLIPEESETMQTALARLDAKTRYDRIFRIRRAVQCSIAHRLLPRAEWTKPENDERYLSPVIALIEAEKAEKAALDTMTVHKKH
ncbi:unnamed protein product [Discula destructiva]